VLTPRKPQQQSLRAPVPRIPKAGRPKRKPRKTAGLQRYATLLRQALEVKKPAGPQLETLLRPEYGESGRVSKDAERLLGVSRKVH
jgi:hypothetical protein